MGLRVPKGQLTGLSNLSRPDANLTPGQDSQLALQQQQMVSQAVASGQPITRGQVAQAGTQMTQQVGQAQTQQLAKTGQATLQQRQLTAQQAISGGQRELQDKALGLQKREREFQNQFYKLNGALADDLFNKQMTFQRDELDRTQWQTRQLMDWAISKARSEEELADLEQTISQASDRKLQILKAAYAKINQALEQDFTFSEQAKDQEYKMKLIQKAAAIQEKIRKQQAQDQMMGTIISEGMGILAAGAAIAAQQPQFAAAAYMGGKGLGTMTYGATR